MRLRFAATLGSLFALSSLVATERPALACGGCFVPQEGVTVVTDHRMILSVRQGETTLYDQIRYRGSPESFAWVLPITGEADVGLSADGLFGILDQTTQVRVLQAPRRACPGPPCALPTSTATAVPTSGASDPNGVTVTKSEVVGPYETVQLQATNPEALAEWLATNKFTVPEDVKPVIAQYVRENFNFLAMKLIPGASVQAMRPVRVTTKGASVTLPLRMVAAGTGAVVGIGLLVLGEGRYEPQNFPSFVIAQDELTWDFASSRSDYTDLRGRKSAATNGRGWEVESSIELSPRGLAAQLKAQLGREGADDYAPIVGDAGPNKSASQVRDEDLAVLLDTSKTAVRITRLRSDLVHAALNEDLVLTATSDQSVLGTTRQPTKSINEPPCPVFKCPPAPVPDDGATLEGGSCAVGPGDASSGLALASVVALALVARARRRGGR